MTDARIAKSWWFKSSSNESKVYETILYTDGTTSCNCFGWTRRCKDGVRSCKHTRMVESGIADSYCETSSGQLAPPAKRKPSNTIRWKISVAVKSHGRIKYENQTYSYQFGNSC